MVVRALILVAVLLLAGCGSTTTDRPPNFIIILVDDMGYTGPSSYGNSRVDTPNFDRLAREGMRFTAAYTTPVCAPTRAEILTGKYSARLGITKAGPPEIHRWARARGAEIVTDLGFSEYTLAEALRDAGYATGQLGKWHLGIGDDTRAFQISRLADIETMREQHGFDYVSAGVGMEEDKMVRDLTDKAIDFVRRHRDEPFFLYLGHASVHTQIVVPEQYVKKYLDRGHPKAGPDQAEGVHTADYLAMIDYLDRQTGRLLDALDGFGLADDTLVLFLSDNGGLTRVTSNQPLRRGKGTCYEGGIRVPFIARWPGSVPPESVSDTPVHSIDLYPTLLEIAGASSSQADFVDGVSLVPLLTNSGEFPERNLYWHMPHYIAGKKSFFGVTPHSAIRSGDFKLLEFHYDYLEVDPEADSVQSRARYVGQPGLELYNVVDDIGETRNLADDERHGPVLADLQGRLRKWRESVNARMPRPNPQYDPAARYPSRGSVSPRPPLRSSRKPQLVEQIPGPSTQ